MKNTYFDLIDQSYYFPQDGFDLKGGYLTFHGVSLKYLVEKYGTPFKLMYLPRIGEQIKRARNLFRKAIKKHKYSGKYYYAYCTKCCHFSHVVKTAVREGVQLETSSSFDTMSLIVETYTSPSIPYRPLSRLEMPGSVNVNDWVSVVAAAVNVVEPVNAESLVSTGDEQR